MPAFNFPNGYRVTIIGGVVVSAANAPILLVRASQSGFNNFVTVTAIAN
jgi:hypothetical protein